MEALPLPLEPITDGPALTWGQLLARGWARFYRDSKSLVTHRSAARCLLKELPADTQLSEITTDRLNLIVRGWQEAGSSNKTINRKLSMLSRLLRWGWKHGWVESPPYIDRLRETRGRQRWVRDHELDAMVERLPGPMADLVLFLANTGMRLGEAEGLVWDDFHEDFRLAVLGDTKSGYPRGVPLNDTAREAVLRRMDRVTGSGPFEGLYRQKVAGYWAKARAEIGLGDDREFVVHALRHRAASLLIQRGIPVAKVSVLLGHRKLETTMKYTHLSSVDLRDAVGLLG